MLHKSQQQAALALQVQSEWHRCLPLLSIPFMSYAGTEYTAKLCENLQSPLQKSSYNEWDLHPSFPNLVVRHTSIVFLLRCGSNHALVLP